MQKEEFMNELLAFMKDEAYKPLTVQELEVMMEITNPDDYKELVKALVMLEDQGLIVRTRSDRYGVPEKMNLVKGKLSAHAKGFAFVTPEEFGQDDIFIPPNELGTAMNGDTVMVRVSHKSNGTKKKGLSSEFWSVILRRLSVPIQKRKALALSFLMIKKSQPISSSRNPLKMERSKGIKWS